MTKIKQTIEKLVSICRTVGMHSMREFVVHIYIYIFIQYLQSQVAFFFQLADHVTELCLDKVEANCKWLFFRQSKHDLYFSLPLCWLRAMPSQTYVQPIAGIAAGQGQLGQMGSLVARWHLFWTCLDKMYHTRLTVSLQWLCGEQRNRAHSQYHFDSLSMGKWRSRHE